jgi:DNA gyrase subunit B
MLITYLKRDFNGNIDYVLYICVLDKITFRINNMSEEIKKDNYSADSIQALEGMEHVRMRPSMYIGDVGIRGLHHLVYEVVDNSIDEAMGGHCDTIRVDINEDGSITVEDNGRGIPVEFIKKKEFLARSCND